MKNEDLIGKEDIMMTEFNQNVNVNTVKKTPKSLVVNFFAGPGAGKSTTAAGLFTLLKLHDVEAEYVPEFAKDLVWEERFKTFDNQFYIFGKQQHRLWRVSDQVNVALVDSPLILSNIYGEIYQRTDTGESFYKYVLDEFNRYRNLNIFIERVKDYKNYGRNEDEEKAREIDNFIKNYLKTHGIPYFSIYGNWKGINDAFQIVAMHTGYRQKISLSDQKE